MANRYWTRPVVATLALFAAWLVFIVLGQAHQHQVIGRDVTERINAEGKVDVVVSLSVEPERFHSTYLRNVAPVGGRVLGSDFFLANLDRGQLARVARPLWVRSVGLWRRE